MMRTLTVRMDDEHYEELVAMARFRGTTLSDLARDTLRGLSDGDANEDGDFRSLAAPESLSAVERLNLSLLHRILARLVVEDPSTEDGDPEYQFSRAKVLENGWISEYSDEFISIGPEVSRRDTTFVMDVLDMFTQIDWSIEKLSEDDVAALGEDAVYGLRFRGFDFNNRREGVMANYARYLISGGRWEGMGKYFDDQHERGNSHGPTYDLYARMLLAFRPIWRKRTENMTAMRGGYELKLDELRELLDAQVHPERRG